MSEFENMINQQVALSIAQEGASDCRLLIKMLDDTLSPNDAYYGAAAVFNTFMINFACALERAPMIGMDNAEGLQSSLVVAGTFLLETARLFQENQRGSTASDTVQEVMQEALDKESGE